ncbi:ATP-dependent DNA helicase DDM1 [Platanthera guangdongensis]|uniref:ATP-dependent DNA helicase DDM1 n=1 Tax=Platanthera guangdongensis TaxID=2320717 RepID=A0ABR2MLR1_9ASPA
MFHQHQKMGRDNCLAHQKMGRENYLEDDSTSNHRTRKLESLYTTSSLEKKLKSSVKGVSGSPMRGGSAGSDVDSEKFGSRILEKNRIKELRIRSSRASDKAKKITSPVVFGDNGEIASSSTNSSLRGASIQSKARKLGEKKLTSEPLDSETEDTCTKTGRKHLHVRAYINLFKKPGIPSGNLGNTNGCIKKGVPLPEITSLGINRDEDTEVVLLDSSSSDIINQEHHSKFSECKRGRMTLNLKPNNLLKPSGKEEYNHESSKINMDSSPSTLEELGFEDNEVCNEEFLRCPDQLVDKENLRIKHNVCLVCKQTGRLICCCGNGCKQSYHLSCFNPRFYDIPPGTWLCKLCVKKKMESGVYSVSNGIESVWDVDEGLQSEKKYFVKYKGLAHLHNRWILESELLRDFPSLLDKFRRRGQKEVTRWRKEWIEPERFLQKRLVGLPKVVDEHTSVPVSHPLNCCSEWLVKWKGLQYDQATWELESSLLLLCSESPILIEDYERRREHTRRSYDPHRTEKAQQVKKDPLCNLSKLPDGCPVELDSDCLSSVNSLREFWHKSLNAVVIDGHERITRAIMFVLSLQSHACQPSLIITTTGSLQLWQADFRRLAPSMNVIMYQGDKHVRKLIQNVEFYDKSGRLMFQVLLADPKSIVELDWAAAGLCEGGSAVGMDRRWPFSCVRRWDVAVEELKVASDWGVMGMAVVAWRVGPTGTGNKFRG